MFTQKKIIIICIGCAVIVPAVLVWRHVVKTKTEMNALRNELTGTWMITDDGVYVLRKLGYEIYTNRADHILLLNPGGTCVFTSFNEYLSPFHRQISEELLHDGFIQESSAMWPKGVENTYSWYVGDMQTKAVRGPYYTTNVALNASERLHKNRMTHWELVPPWAQPDWMRDADSGLGVRCKWHLRLTHPEFSTMIFFHVTRHKEGTLLWRSSIAKNWYGDKVEFQKISGDGRDFL